MEDKVFESAEIQTADMEKPLPVIAEDKDLSVSAKEIPVEQKIFGIGLKILSKYTGIKASDADRIQSLKTDCQNLFYVGKDNFQASDLGRFMAAAVISYYRTVICSNIDNSDLTAEKAILSECWDLIKKYNRIAVDDEQAWEIVFKSLDEIVRIRRETCPVHVYCFAMDMAKIVAEYLDDHGRPQDFVIEARKHRLPYLKKLCMASAAA